MGKYVFIYTGGGTPATEEEGKRLMEAWGGFLGGLGDALVDGGAPFGPSRSVNGNGTSGATGYSIVNASSLDDALSKTSGCPIFESGGDVEVYETIEM
jgi:hypothetical protein